MEIRVGKFLLNGGKDRFPWKKAIPSIIVFVSKNSFCDLRLASSHTVMQKGTIRQCQLTRVVPNKIKEGRLPFFHCPGKSTFCCGKMPILMHILVTVG